MSVGFDYDARSQIVEHQSLVGFGNAEFPGQAGVFDAGLRGRACAAVESRYEYHIAVAFGYARCDDADIDFCDEFDVNSGMVVGVFEIVNELRQIFDGVNIVMRRR